LHAHNTQPLSRAMQKKHAPRGAHLGLIRYPLSHTHTQGSKVHRSRVVTSSL
jgi:hypothetical protein